MLGYIVFKFLTDMEGFMKLVLMLALLASFSAFAQTATESAPAATTTQDTMGTPAAGEGSMNHDMPKVKKHKKVHAKKKHHKKKKKHQAQ